MDEVETAVLKLQQLVSDINTKGSQDTVATIDIYASLQYISTLAASTHIPVSQIVATSTLSCLQELLTSKSILITYALQSILVKIYTTIFIRETPGYIIRSILQTLITICNGKVKTVGALECAIQLLGAVFEIRLHDCISLKQDIFLLIIKFARSSEYWLKEVSIKALRCMVNGCGYDLIEYYPDLVKLSSRLVKDLSPDVRLAYSRLVHDICNHASLTEHKYIEVFIPILVKGLDDEVPIVQDSYASVLSHVSTLIRNIIFIILIFYEAILLQIYRIFNRYSINSS